MDRDDLTEVLGNILDNARKWARSNVMIAGDATEETIALAIEDDGPGVDEGQISRLIERGHRDTASKGSGLGLAIAQEILEAYGGRLTLGPGDLGGLKVLLELPNR